MGSGKVCKMGHAYAGYFTDCPFCVSEAARPASSKPKSVTLSRTGEPSVTPSQDGDAVTGVHCPTCTCTDRKAHVTNAARQRAYRERKGGALPEVGIKS